MTRYDNFITKSERNYENRVKNVYISFIDEPREGTPIQLVKINEIGDLDLYFQRTNSGDIRIINGNILMMKMRILKYKNKKLSIRF